MENKNKRPWLDILVIVISIAVSVAIIALAALQISGVWEDSIDLVVPLLGVSTLCQAYTQWSRSRRIAYFCIGTAVFIFACSIAVFFLK